MVVRDELIDSIAKSCEKELNYYDVVNESAEMVEYRLIVEFILEIIFDVWNDGRG